ncbi:hypothetical protein [Chryseobacterium rhizosphaerae]|nr:hypothetical protein [Chryseobacterium rhizosphaerae]MDC8101553.1 hypothetical protein [Chryseobacterium rhizosphaerae]
MKKIDLKKLKGSLSREEQRTIKGGLIKEDPDVLSCGCVSAACYFWNNTGDAHCTAGFCCR